MSYTTGTTHYNLPQTVGSDKRDWTDTNEAFSDVDAALWEAHQGATQAALDIASINSEIQTITGKQADDEADIATISGKVSTLETTVANHTTEIGDVRRDLQDNIESLREDTATSTHAYAIGDYFYYNDVLFKATAQIAIGATIVPNTNCTGVTVMDELKNGGVSSDLIETFSGSVTDAESNTYTAITTDGIAYDATNQQLLLKVDGADTVIPFKKGGLSDINAAKSDTFALIVGADPSIGQAAFLPVHGFSTLSLKPRSSDVVFTCSFVDASGTDIESVTVPTSGSTWTDHTIPATAVYFKSAGTYSGGTNYGAIVYALTV